MSNFNYTVGLNNVGSYQVSTKPHVSFVSSSTTLQISFPNVTKFVIVKNLISDGYMKVAFSANGLNTNNFLVLSGSESFSADYKVTSVFLAPASDFGGTYFTASVIAGLTGIEAYHLSGNWSGSAGVG